MSHALEHEVHDLTVEACALSLYAEYCAIQRKAAVYPLNNPSIHQPHPVARGLQCSTALQSSTVYSYSALYNIQPLHHPSGLYGLKGGGTACTRFTSVRP
eukprot:3239196-Prymnesium_polylepis.1